MPKLLVDWHKRMCVILLCKGRERNLTFMLILERIEALFQVGSNNVSILLKVLFLNYFENSVSCSSTHRVSSKCVEIGSTRQDFCNFRSGYHGTKRYAIANALYVSQQQI